MPASSLAPVGPMRLRSRLISARAGRQSRGAREESPRELNLRRDIRHQPYMELASIWVPEVEPSYGAELPQEADVAERAAAETANPKLGRGAGQSLGGLVVAQAAAEEVSLYRVFVNGGAWTERRDRVGFSAPVGHLLGGNSLLGRQ